MKIIVLFLSLIMSSYLLANENSDWLQENNPHGYFPIDAEYLNFSSICNEETCFSVVMISYVTSTNKGMRRLAVFSNTGDYLGVYSGFQELPVKVNGSELIFPKSDWGNSISFIGKEPPKSVYIDGEHFQFELTP